MHRESDILKSALSEDIGSGDITTRYFSPRKTKFTAVMKAKENGTVCGLEIAGKIFRMLSPRVRIKFFSRDGDRVRRGAVLMEVRGGPEILTAERTALNFVQRLSGIATMTAHFVKAARGKTLIYDTRKTTPGLREFEKYAVACGGGKNHRKGLYDAFLIKDNHITSLGGNYLRELKKRISEARKKHPGKRIEIEAGTLKQAAEFAGLDVDIIMLDNMPPVKIGKAVKAIREKNGKVEIEVSGNMEPEKISRIASMGIDRISAGKITHSVRALDISFDIVPER